MCLVGLIILVFFVPVLPACVVLARSGDPQLHLGFFERCFGERLRSWS